MNLLDYHVLLALSSGPMHGYAIKDAVAEDSDGSQAPLAGTLYRVIARLITEGLVRETSSGGNVVHPGHARRYYTLSAAGRRVLAEQARQLKEAAARAERRLSGNSGRS